MSNGSTILALDVGTVRVGVAIMRMDVKIPRPLTTVLFRSEIFTDIEQLAKEYDARLVVVGWPRGMEGQATAQTRLVEEFVSELRGTLKVPIELQDEALTSHKAEAELKARRKPFEKEEVDALAATFILEDYVASNPVIAAGQHV